VFAAKAAPTNTCKTLCVLCASARKQDVKLPESVGYVSGENLQQLSDRIATGTFYASEILFELSFFAGAAALRD
jgi:hypothetical protein